MEQNIPFNNQDKGKRTQWRPLAGFLATIIAAVMIGLVVVSNLPKNSSDYQSAFKEWSMLQSQITQALAAYNDTVYQSCVSTYKLRLEALRADLASEKPLTPEERDRIKKMIATNDCINPNDAKKAQSAQ